VIDISDEETVKMKTPLSQRSKVLIKPPIPTTWEILFVIAIMILNGSFVFHVVFLSPCLIWFLFYIFP